MLLNGLLAGVHAAVESREGVGVLLGRACCNQALEGGEAGLLRLEFLVQFFVAEEVVVLVFGPGFGSGLLCAVKGEVDGAGQVVSATALGSPLLVSVEFLAAVPLARGCLVVTELGPVPSLCGQNGVVGYGERVPV